MSETYGSNASSDICPECKQEIAETCPTCDQFIRDAPDEEDVCQECGQELPEENEASDEEDDKDSTNGEDFIKLKHHARQPICKVCRRKRPYCPDCQETFEESREEDECASTEESTSESSSEEEGGGKKRARKEYIERK